MDSERTEKKKRELLSEEEKKMRLKVAYDRYRRENRTKFRWMVKISTEKYNEKNREIIKEKYLKRYQQKKENQRFLNILLD